MNASIRTLIYAGVAAAFAGTAYVTHLMMLPPDLSGFDRVGQKFYPQFDNPEAAVRFATNGRTQPGMGEPEAGKPMPADDSILETFVRPVIPVRRFRA